jgi:hypothetical protein
MNDSSLDLIWQLTRQGISPEGIVDYLRGRGFREIPALLFNMGLSYLTAAASKRRFRMLGSGSAWSLRKVHWMRLR